MSTPARHLNGNRDFVAPPRKVEHQVVNDCVESLRQLIRLQKKNKGASPLTEYPVSPADVDNFYASGSDSDRAGKRADEIAFD